MPDPSRPADADVNRRVEPARGEDLTSSLTPGFATPAVKPALESTATLLRDLPNVDMEPVFSERLGRYQLLRLLGRGGIGQVWEAYDPELQRRVAIKLLRADRLYPADAVDQFLAEGRRLAQLNHPDIVKVYDCGREQDQCFLVSELVEGGTLADALAKRNYSIEESAELVAILAVAAQHAHHLGLVHRDIKPSNILLGPTGRPMLCDFGLAISEPEMARETPGAYGTLVYMSPEQIRGESHLSDGRTDVYALGMVLYELLTRRLPFVFQDVESYQQAVLTRDPWPLRSIREEIPPELERICLKCLARERADRYTTARELAEQLQSFLGAGKSIAPRKATSWWGVGMGGLALALVVFLAFAGRGQFAPTGQQAASPPGAPQTDAPSIPPPLPPVAVREIRIAGEDVATWEIVEQRNVLRVTTEDLCLLSLGDYDGGQLSLAVDLEQRNWPGGAGLFFGWQRAGGKPENVRLCIFKLLRSVAGEFRMTAAASEWPLAKPHLAITQEFVRKQLPQLTAEPLRLRLELSQGVLKTLEVTQGAFRADLADRLPAVPSDTLRGSFGLWTFDSSAKYSRPELNGELVQFARAPDPN